MDYQYDLIIADLRLRICSLFPVNLPECFRPFLAEVSPVKPDFSIFVYTDADFPYAIQKADTVQRYEWKKGQYITRTEPCDEPDKIYLVIPESFREIFSQNANWLLYLAPERMLIKRERVILHASAVLYEGFAYLFTAPSGGGKSTQARIWENHLHAEVMNGDKVILRGNKTGLFAYGSPIAGSSGIYKNISAPVAAIVKIEKATYNRVSVLSKRDSFLLLYSDAVKSEWDIQFNKHLMSILERFPGDTQVIRLECLPDASAADCLIRSITNKERNQIK